MAIGYPLEVGVEAAVVETLPVICQAPDEAGLTELLEDVGRGFVQKGLVDGRG